MPHSPYIYLHPNTLRFLNLAPGQWRRPGERGYEVSTALGKCVLLLHCHLCRVRQALRQRINRGSCGQVTSMEQEGRPIPGQKDWGIRPSSTLPLIQGTVPQNEKWWRKWKTTKQNKIRGKNELTGSQFHPEGKADCKWMIPDWILVTHHSSYA